MELRWDWERRGGVWGADSSIPGIIKRKVALEIEFLHTYPSGFFRGWLDCYGAGTAAIPILHL